METISSCLQIYNIVAFKDSVSKLEYCKCGENDSDCTPYLDTLFTVPKYLYSEIVSKIIEKLLGQTSKVQEDENLNKNTNIFFI